MSAVAFPKDIFSAINIYYLCMASGHAEWADNAHTSLRMILKSADVLAGELYTWVLKNELLGNVYTIYELHSSDDYQDSGNTIIISNSYLHRVVISNIVILRNLTTWLLL